MFHIRTTYGDGYTICTRSPREMFNAFLEETLRDRGVLETNGFWMGRPEYISDSEDGHTTTEVIRIYGHHLGDSGMVRYTVGEARRLL